MALGERIKHLSKSSFSVVATAKVAKVAKVEGNLTLLEPKSRPTFATIAEIAVAGSGKIYIPPPASLPQEGIDCPLCGGDLSREGIDGCYYRNGEVPYPEQVIDGLHPCSLCGGDFFYEGNRGGYFCKKCQSLPEGAEPVQVVRGKTPRGKDSLRGNDPGWFWPGQDGAPIQRARTGKRLSPKAVAWLQEHRQVLKAAGWTGRELYRRNKSKGLVWAGIWDTEGSKITVKDNGVISFQFYTATGQMIIQTARPQKLKSRR